MPSFPKIAVLLLFTASLINGCGVGNSNTRSEAEQKTVEKVATEIDKKKEWCERYPQSAVCPEAVAQAQRKAEWCAKYPTSAVCPGN